MKYRPKPKFKTPPILLYAWSTGWHPDCDPYMAPELRTLHLHGEIPIERVKHRRERVVSSAITAVDGRFVTTESGHVYQLKSPDRKWKAWLKTQGIVYDTHEPIKFEKKEIL